MENLVKIRSLVQNMHTLKYDLQKTQRNHSVVHNMHFNEYVTRSILGSNDLVLWNSIETEALRARIDIFNPGYDIKRPRQVLTVAGQSDLRRTLSVEFEVRCKMHH